MLWSEGKKVCCKDPEQSPFEIKEIYEVITVIALPLLIPYPAWSGVTTDNGRSRNSFLMFLSPPRRLMAPLGAILPTIPYNVHLNLYPYVQGFRTFLEATTGTRGWVRN